MFVLFLPVSFADEVFSGTRRLALVSGARNRYRQLAPENWRVCHHYKLSLPEVLVHIWLLCLQMLVHYGSAETEQTLSSLSHDRQSSFMINFSCHYPNNPVCSLLLFYRHSRLMQLFNGTDWRRYRS